MRTPRWIVLAGTGAALIAGAGGPAQSAASGHSLVVNMENRTPHELNGLLTVNQARRVVKIGSESVEQMTFTVTDSADIVAVFHDRVRENQVSCLRSLSDFPASATSINLLAIVSSDRCDIVGY